MKHENLVFTTIETPIGSLVATADNSGLHSLEFLDYVDTHDFTHLTHEMNPILNQLKVELDDYFSGKIVSFKTPLHLSGTSFQNQVWKSLQKIPYGKTQSYAELAAAIGKPTAYRAAAQANGRNKIIIVIPCHRVINSDGGLGGFSSGLERKKWLLAHEKGIQ